MLVKQVWQNYEVKPLKPLNMLLIPP